MFVALAVAALSQGQTPAGTAVLASVHQFVDAFNKGDTKAMIAACAERTSIIDEFPPHEWQGAGACAKWIADYDVDAKKNGITDGAVTLNTPSHVDVTAGDAYVVIPVNYVFKQKGKAVSEIGSVITLALHKTSAGWRITGWAWAKH